MVSLPSLILSITKVSFVWLQVKQATLNLSKLVQQTKVRRKVCLMSHKQRKLKMCCKSRQLSLFYLLLLIHLKSLTCFFFFILNLKLECLEFHIPQKSCLFVLIAGSCNGWMVHSLTSFLERKWHTKYYYLVKTLNRT